MGTRTPLDRSIEQPAQDRVLEYLEHAKRNGQVVFPLVEIAEETSLDPTTAAAVMDSLEKKGPFSVSNHGGRYGELRWLVYE